MGLFDVEAALRCHAAIPQTWDRHYDAQLPRDASLRGPTPTQEGIKDVVTTSYTRQMESKRAGKVTGILEAEMGWRR